jgi:proliferating cell nuclear antigen PCNA
MTILFSCKTNEGHIIKILAELLQNNIKNGCFVIDEKGIHLRMMDSNKRILIDIDLLAENFSLYKFNKALVQRVNENGTDKLYIGISNTHFHKMLKSIKKKDSVALFIDDEAPTDLGIKIIPKEKNRVTTSFIKIQNIQQIGIDFPSGYGKPVIVPSNEYQKMTKDMSNIGNLITVESKNFIIKFGCNQGSVYSREVVFGETDDDFNDDEKEMKEVKQEFETEQLSRISKIAGLSVNMQIYQSDNLPLLFRSNIGSLGKISIYVKSKKEIDEDERANLSVDEE